MPLRSQTHALRKRRSNLAGFAVLGLAIIVAALLLGRKEKVDANSSAPAPVVTEFDTVKLPVPLEYVPAGVKLKDIKLKQVAFPKHQVPSGALSSVDNLLEATTLAPLPANLPLFEDNFSFTEHTNNPVLERIPAGMRAMTVRVDATAAVEGWAGSGSFVDVLLVQKDRTSVVAEKVKILSAERSVSPVEGQAAPNVPSTVTLLVTQEQCLAINTAIPLGKIAFALRSLHDEDSWRDVNFTSDRLSGRAMLAPQKSNVSGFASVRDGNSEKSFALTDGKWIKSEVIPQGFLAAKENRESNAKN